MNWFYCLVITFVPFVLCDGGVPRCRKKSVEFYGSGNLDCGFIKLLEPCAIRDIDCLSHSTEQFLGLTCKGISEYNMKAIDPFVRSEPLTYVVDAGLGIVFRFENLNVTGLRNQKISDFQMNTTTKSVLLKTRADVNIVSDIRIELDGNPFTGTYQASASVLGTARYKYDFTKDSKNVEYFVVGPETLTCEVIEEPNVSVSHPLETALANDDVAKSKLPAYSANKSNYRKHTICKIAEEAYKAVIHNIRAAAKILPKTAFFKDI